MVVGGLVIEAAARLRDAVEAATGRPFAESYADYAREHGALRIDEQFEALPRRRLRRRDVQGRCVPGIRLGGVRGGG